MRNVLPGVVTTIADISRSAEKETVRTRLADHVKKQIKDCIDNMIPGKFDPRVLGLLVNQLLHQLQAEGSIRTFSVGDITHGPSKPFREVSCLSPTTQPGDALVVEVPQPDGSVKEEYRGIVISTDGEGNGVVFQKPGEPGEVGEVQVECFIQPSFPVESIAITVKTEG